MIRYLRNEQTNLEAKAIALKTALAFGKPEALSKILVSLMATERNFVLKKGERVLTDLLYENSEILFEKIVGYRQAASHASNSDASTKARPEPKA